MKENWGRWMVIFTLMVGIIFHSTCLIVGVDTFQEIFTPTVDAIFTIPIIFGIIGMIATWRYFQFRGRIEKGIIIFSLAYFILTMPLHLRTWFTNNTEYIISFPWWYSIIFISYSSVLIFVWTRLQTKRTTS